MNDWWAKRRMCFDGANRENLLQCIMWRHPFYTEPIIQYPMLLWKVHTGVEFLVCVSGHPHACVSAAKGLILKELVTWLGPKVWLASPPVCLKLADIERACEGYATQEVCRGQTWHGEGTIKFDLLNNGEGGHQQIWVDGPFTITFGVQEDGTIEGEGAATLTLDAVWSKGGENPGQCTVHGRDMVLISVSGMKEDGKLKLMFDSSPEGYHTTASCSSEVTPALEWFRSGTFVEKYFGVFFDQNEPLVVVAQDGEEESLVEDLTEQYGVEPFVVLGGRIFHIRLKARSR